MYFLLTGAFPFGFPAKRAPMDVILNEGVIPIRKRLASIPKPLAVAIDRAVRKKGKDRYSDAGALLKALHRQA